eukprot:9361329-Heterocapsa_arctica.AAC.1
MACTAVRSRGRSGSLWRRPVRPRPQRVRHAPRCAGPTAVDGDAPQRVHGPGTIAPSSSRFHTPTRRASTACP